MELKNKIFLVATIICTCTAAWFINETASVWSRRAVAYPSSPQAYDFVLSLQALVGLVALRYLFSKGVFIWLGNKVIAPKYVGDHRVERVERFATVFFKFNYFLVASLWGYYLLRDQEWTPPILGGHGETAACWTDFLNQNIPPFVKEYYMVSLAYHLQSLIFHVISTHRNDFLEMLIHHIMAVFLIAFSYMINYVRIGTLVLFIHDVADVPGYLVKSFVDTPHTAATLTVYGTLLFVWAYTRLYIFPSYIIWSTLFETEVVPEDERHGKWFFIGMLVGLFLLHCFWYTLFMRMGYIYATKRKAVDIQQKIKDEDDPTFVKKTN